MTSRRSSRSATAPATGPSSSAGSSDVSQTPPTAAPRATTPFPARSDARVDSATRLSQSPRLDSEVAIHSLRNGLMDSTLACAARAGGDRKFTALGYRSRTRGAALISAIALPNGHIFPGTGTAAAGPLRPPPTAVNAAQVRILAHMRPQSRTKCWMPAPERYGRLDREAPPRRAPLARPGPAARPVPPLAGLPARRRGLAGPAARRSASNSTARCRVTDSTLSLLRSEALVSPSVTYGPNRPSLSTIGRLLDGSSPSSRSGGAAARLRPRVLGCADSSLASARLRGNSWFSLSSERLSLPFLT